MSLFPFILTLSRQGRGDDTERQDIIPSPLAGGG